jgi:hypothetical protein
MQTGNTTSFLKLFSVRRDCFRRQNQIRLISHGFGENMDKRELLGRITSDSSNERDVNNNIENLSWIRLRGEE